jgi:iron complex transport system ATP-binding protein
MVTGRHIAYTHRHFPILQGVNVEVAYGEVLAIVGPNGAGKSTLLNILANELKHSQVEFKGKPFPEWDAADLSLLKAKFSQHFSSEIPLNVKEVVMMGRYPYFEAEPQQEDEAAVASCMKRMGLEEMGQRTYSTLSGGEKQRVHLARVLAQLENEIRHKLLLLDEPLNNLDVRHQHEVLALLSRLSTAGLSLVVVMHDLNLAARYADRVLLLHQGKTLCIGKPEEVLTVENISTAYGYPCRILEDPESGKKIILFGD